MRYPRVDAAIETCGRHLATTTANPEIDVVLAKHVASVGYAEFEQRIRDLIGARCSHHSDAPVARFASVAATRLIRSIKITELSGALGWFSPGAKQAFTAAMEQDPEAVASWNNILTGRHSLAHEEGETPPTLTFADVQRDVEGAKRIVAAFSAALDAEYESSAD